MYLCPVNPFLKSVFLQHVKFFFKKRSKKVKNNLKSMFLPLNYALLELKKMNQKMNLNSLLNAKSIVKTPLVDLLTVQKLEKKS